MYAPSPSKRQRVAPEIAELNPAGAYMMVKRIAPCGSCSGASGWKILAAINLITPNSTELESRIMLENKAYIFVIAIVEFTVILKILIA